MLVRCLYSSRRTAPRSVNALELILDQSRRNNLKRGITGLLCVTADLFVQVIEGGRDEVSDLLCTIARDDRHKDLRLLSYEEINERQFGDWSMGQVDIANINPALLLKYGTKVGVDPFSMPGRATMSLLIELAASGSISSRSGLPVEKN